MLIFITFCIIVIIQTFIYFFLFGKFAFSKQESKNYKHFPISVIICAKNEENNLKKNLSSIARQNYDDLEIVLIDDASNDGSLGVMHHFKNINNRLNIQIISISASDSNGKKYALSKGIQAAKNDFLILTDADCSPLSNSWVREMSSHFSKNKSVVLGYGAYRKIDNSFINKLIRFETLLTAVQYFSYAQIGKAYMGVGRNIAYKKREFLNANGFSKHKHIISGDDDLFINQIATIDNTAICYSKQSFTISEPEIKLKNWIYQKRRHISTSTHYKFFHKIALGIFFLSQLLFWVLAFILILLNINVTLTLSLIFLRLFIWYIIIIKSAQKLDEKDLIIFAPLYEISIIFMQLYIFIRNIISSPKYW
jgi:glycosyltransferase involved in cell wall biosynthesis